jgi:ElaB/YqjD/DUF883 family membrane-anchored ribosome-binding protein
VDDEMDKLINNLSNVFRKEPKKLSENELQQIANYRQEIPGIRKTLSNMREEIVQGMHRLEAANTDIAMGGVKPADYDSHVQLATSVIRSCGDSIDDALANADAILQQAASTSKSAVSAAMPGCSRRWRPTASMSGSAPDRGWPSS